VASKEYQVFIAPLKEKYPNAFNNTEDTPNVGENFINIREKCSLVSSIGTHLGGRFLIHGQWFLVRIPAAHIVRLLI
jgi:hypothetical protein